MCLRNHRYHHHWASVWDLILENVGWVLTGYTAIYPGKLTFQSPFIFSSLNFPKYSRLWHGLTNVSTAFHQKILFTFLSSTCSIQPSHLKLVVIKSIILIRHNCTKERGGNLTDDEPKFSIYFSQNAIFTDFISQICNKSQNIHIGRRHVLAPVRVKCSRDNRFHFGGRKSAILRLLEIFLTPSVWILGHYFKISQDYSYKHSFFNLLLTIISPWETKLIVYV
jgi:hypothetical protein